VTHAQDAGATMKLTHYQPPFFMLTCASFYTRLAIFLWEIRLASAKNLLPRLFQTTTVFQSNCLPESP